MVLAGQNARCSALTLDNRVRTMPTNLVESIDVPVAVLDQEEPEPGFGDSDKVSCLHKACLVRD